ncbi:hypothetical protein CL617_05745 [archaeon]|nr:hypothetical protein [archaeon]|tara:strand:- start:1233 stop:1976 length:744 start_codon:yes stop_codon:yes gene_type:complete
MNINNDFSSSAKYYDIMQDNSRFRKSVKFVIKTLKEKKITSVLELGCGSGYYLFPIKNAGYNIEGLDIGKNILNEVKKKDKVVKLYLEDMSKFKIDKKFDSIICLNSSLVLLPDFTLMKKTLKKVHEHLNDSGLFMLDVPNHEVEIKESNNTQDSEKFKLKNGVMHVVYRDYKKENKWIAEEKCFVNENGKYFEFEEKFAELIFNPNKLEKELKKIGFNIEVMYGGRSGENFNKNRSRRRFYICKKS